MQGSIGYVEGRKEEGRQRKGRKDLGGINIDNKKKNKRIRREETYRIKDRERQEEKEDRRREISKKTDEINRDKYKEAMDRLTAQTVLKGRDGSCRSSDEVENVKKYIWR